MTVAEWCIFGTLMLYLLTIVPIKWIGFRGFDNARPRDPAFYQDPIRFSPSRCCWRSFVAARSG